MNVANSLSPHLFWDTKISELDFQKNKRLIIDRVLHRGSQKDWDFITKVYKKDNLVEVLCNLPSIAPKEANYVALLFNIDKNQMKCFTNKRSNHYY